MKDVEILRMLILFSNYSIDKIQLGWEGTWDIMLSVLAIIRKTIIFNMWLLNSDSDNKYDHI